MRTHLLTIALSFAFLAGGCKSTDGDKSAKAATSRKSLSVSFTNHRWNRGVHLQIQAGRGGAAGANPTIADINLAYGQTSPTYYLTSGDDVWWRRNANPDDPSNPNWNVWTHKALASSGHYDIDAD